MLQRSQQGVAAMPKYKYLFFNGLFMATGLIALNGCASGGLKVIEAHYKNGTGRDGGSGSLEYYCLKGATAACEGIGREQEVAPTMAVVQGMTDTQATIFAVLLPHHEDVSYAVVARDRKAKNKFIRFEVLPPSQVFKEFKEKWRVEHLVVTDLQVGQLYELWIMSDRGTLLDRRQFQALDLNKRNPRLVVGSCMDEGFHAEQKRAWVQIKNINPDAIFLLGDNVYSNKFQENPREPVPPEVLWTRYIQMRNALDIYRWRELTPVFATWDDNDYGMNDGDETYLNKADSLKMFFVFFPRSEKVKAVVRGPGAAFTLNGFGQSFFFFDDRSFRTPNKIDQENQSHFGLAQETWFYEQLEQLNAPFWLISGDQFFGGYHSFESYEGSHPKSFTRFLNRVAKAKRPYIFVSGDRHMTEILKLSNKEAGRETYELTASPIHARTFPNAIERNPTKRRLEASSGPFNFMEVKVNNETTRYSLNVKAWGVDEGLLFERNLRFGGNKSGRHKR